MQENKVLELVESGNLLNAVREYREFTSADLTMANNFVSELAKCADIKTSKVSVPKYSLDYLNSLEFFDTDSFSSFSDFQRKLMNDLYGLNYQPTFDTKLIKVPESKFSIFEVIKKAYPESKPSGYSVREVIWDEMKEDISDVLQYEGDYGSHPNKFMLPKLNQVTNSYWSHVQGLVASQDTQIFSYDLEDGLPGYYVFWMFSYFIYDPKQGYCLSLVGSCSD